MEVLKVVLDTNVIMTAAIILITLNKRYVLKLRSKKGNSL